MLARRRARGRIRKKYRVREWGDDGKKQVPFGNDRKNGKSDDNGPGLKHFFVRGLFRGLKAPAHPVEQARASATATTKANTGVLHFVQDDGIVAGAVDGDRRRCGVLGSQWVRGSGNRRVRQIQGWVMSLDLCGALGV
jgi:hypothetical protein